MSENYNVFPNTGNNRIVIPASGTTSRNISTSTNVSVNPYNVLIVSDTAPTTRENGGELVQGDVWWNTTTERSYYYIGTEWKLSTGTEGSVSPGDNVSLLNNDVPYLSTSSSINDLSDVDTTGASVDNTLVWNGTNWVPGSSGASELNDLSDVNITAISSGNFLRYSGDQWENSDLLVSDIPNLSSLYASVAQGTKADSAVQPGDNISTLTNDSGFISDITGETLGDLSDVNLTGISSGDIIAWNGSAWVNGSAPPADISGSSINALNDVDTGTTPPTTGQALIWNNDDGEWQPGDVASDAPVDSVNGQTGVVVLDTDDVSEGTTNKYTTQSDIDKLAGIAEGAEVNVQANFSETNSSSDAFIRNKPTLGTAAATDATDYATASQGTLADSALQPSSIGTTVQPYDVNTVTDASYVHTDNNFTSDEKTKLTGIAEGAEVNVRADYTETEPSSDAFIRNKPTLGTAAATDATDYATAEQGTKADTATQPGDNISTLVNDAGFVTAQKLVELPVSMDRLALLIWIRVTLDWGMSITPLTPLNQFLMPLRLHWMQRQIWLVELSQKVNSHQV